MTPHLYPGRRRQSGDPQDNRDDEHDQRKRGESEPAEHNGNRSDLIVNTDGTLELFIGVAGMAALVLQ